MSTRRHPLADLPRAWRFPRLRGAREVPPHQTYGRYKLDDQPIITKFQNLDWLERMPLPVVPNIASTYPNNYPEQALTVSALEAMAGDLPIPPMLRAFAGRVDLHEKVGSVTSCYLDLAERRVPTSVPGGYLIHFLADQQMTLHWLMYLDAEGNEAVVMPTTFEHIGYGQDFYPEPYDEALSTVEIEPNGRLEVCADSFAEFIYRFWLENELWQLLRKQLPLGQIFTDYVESLRSTYMT